MNITNDEKIINSDGTVTLPYTVVSGRYTFKDAIVGFEDDISAMTAEQILAEQTQRFNNWHSLIMNPPPVPPADPVDPASA